MVLYHDTLHVVQGPLAAAQDGNFRYFRVYLQQVVVKLILPADLMVTLAYMAGGVEAGQVSPELLALETSVAN